MKTAEDFAWNLMDEYQQHCYHENNGAEDKNKFYDYVLLTMKAYAKYVANESLINAAARVGRSDAWKRADLQFIELDIIDPANITTP